MAFESLTNVYRTSLKIFVERKISEADVQRQPKELVTALLEADVALPDRKRLHQTDPQACCRSWY